MLKNYQETYKHKMPTQAEVKCLKTFNQYVTSHVKMSPMLANIKSELIPYLERVCFQLSNDVSFMFLGGFTHK